IEIEKTLDESEKTFVLAHEIAHLILENLVPTPHPSIRAAIGTFSYTEIERLCDICAEELLLPLEWLRDWVDPRVPSFTVVEEVAHISRCQIETAASVIIKNGLWSAKLYWCSWKNGATIVDRSCPPDEPAVLASVRLPLPRVTQASLPSRVVQRDVAVEFGDQRCRYHVEWFIFSREKALALLY
ncbi:MAG TPA: ImmA/IrrE family metallo-endopeptidase, partial [Gemmatimonadales bacterium]|nr:ImmA/IrrE family metallo-endopeptidase [Gemmatimonadales bacterium]